MQPHDANPDVAEIARDLGERIEKHFGVERTRADAAEIEATAESLRRVMRLRTSKDLVSEPDTSR